MTSSSASESVFAASCPLQVATGDHPSVAIVEPERAVVVSVPEGVVLAEIGLREGAEGVDTAWLGQPPRLLIVSRLGGATVFDLLDVTGEGGARILAEKRVEMPMRMFAVGGAYALFAGLSSAGIPSIAILTRTDDNISIHPVAARGIPSAAGALGAQLVLAFAGVIEIWDPAARVAKRRIKLPRPAQISAVGGSDRQIWLTTVTDPQRLEVIPLVNRGQPRVHELPEPIGSVASHPKLDVVVCAGADTGRLFVIDLDGRMPTRDLAHERFGGRPMAMSMIGGRAPAIVAIASGQPPRAVWLDGTPVREWPAPPPPPLVRLEPTMPDIMPLRPAPSSSSSSASSPAITLPPTAARPPSARPPTAPPAPAPTVFDSMLGHAVVAPAPDSPGEMRASISGAATRIQRTPRPSREEPPPSPASSAPARSSPDADPSPPPRASALADRLQAWRERAESGAPPLAEATAPEAAPATAPEAAPATAPEAAPAGSSPPPSSSNEPARPDPMIADVPDDAGDDSDAARPRLPTPTIPNDPDDLAPAPPHPAAAVPTAPMIATPRAPTEPGVAPWSATSAALEEPASATAPRAPAPPSPQPTGIFSSSSEPLLPPEPPPWFVPPPAPAIEPPAAPAEARARNAASSAPSSSSVPAAREDWRLALIDWARATARGQGAPLPLAPPLTSLLARLTLGAPLGPALQMLYACHLLGERAAAPADVAVALTGLPPDERWREALGTGVLARLGLVTLRGSRVRLAGVALRFLDDRPARYGALVGVGRGFPRDRSAAIVIDTAAPELTSLQLAEAAAALVETPVLAVTRSLGSDDDLRAASLEARIRGAIAAISYPWLPSLPAAAPALYLAPSREEAEATGFEILSL